MNFLAHFHLAWPEDTLVVGALEGDFLKGPLRGRLPRDIERGIALHRAIDAYTDSHPLLLDLRRAFPERLRRYTSILADLSFDHYLSRHWNCFSSVPLSDFIPAVHDHLENHRHHLSERAEHMRQRLVHYDLLGRYTDWETVPQSAARVGERFTRGNPFAAIGATLEAARPMMEETFLAFYPQLLEYSAEKKHSLRHQQAG